MRINFIFLLSSCFFTFSVNAQLQVSQAYCNYKTHPNGVLPDAVRFGWELVSPQNEAVQSAYQIVVASSLAKLKAAAYDCWNSGKQESSQSLLIKYEGKTLQPGVTYYWRCRVWGKDGAAAVWSAPQQFITGLVNESDWKQAAWIGLEELEDSLRLVPGVHVPAVGSLGNKAMKRTIIPQFRKEFTVNKKIKNATLFITGLGQYEATLNGHKIGNAFLAPGWTYYDKTVLYNTFDVTRQLKTGTNIIGVIVGNGFYNINMERYYKLVTAFGMPKMLCRLKIEYNDGSVKDIVSGRDWKVAASPIIYSSIYAGEEYDARLEQTGWQQPGFKDDEWRPALLVKAPVGKLVPESDYPIRILDSFSVKKIGEPVAGKFLYDFGQNISGIVQLKVKGQKGQVIKLIPAELVNKEGLCNQLATGDPYFYTYTIRSDKEEIWQPRFTYYGFRYVQVEGAVPVNANGPKGHPQIMELKALHNRNSNPSNGSFECSNPLFNRIYALINWAIKSNMQSVITDCPHREKLSWLEQDYLMGNSIHYNYDIYQLYRKLVNDLIDAQYPQGFVPDIAPEYVVFAGGFLDSPEWGSSAVILPWLLYSWYGDTEVLEKAYPMMRNYVAYLATKASDNILYHGLGDWYDYGPGFPGEAQLTPKAVTATSIYHYDVLLLSRMATVLNKVEDAKALSQQAEAIKASFNKKFFNPFTNVIATGSQTSMAMPYITGLVEEDKKEAVIKNLVDSIYANNKALTAGDIGFNFLVKALDEGGASQLLFDMNNRDDVAGYGFQLKKGATALTESWAALEEVSNNHLMLGHIMEWFYSGLAGIAQEENSIGYKKIKIRPQPVGDITSAKGRFHTPYGWVVSSWRKNENLFIADVEVPVNSEAVLYLPVSDISFIYINGKILKRFSRSADGKTSRIGIGAGKYHVEVVN